MKRRTFLKDTALLVAAASTGGALKATEKLASSTGSGTGKGSGAGDGKLIVSAPMLQNYAETSIGVAFAVSDLANGYVIVGEKPDLSDGRKVLCGGYRDRKSVV